MLPEITCIIIDDEQKAIDLLERRLNILYPNIRILGKYQEWSKGLEVLRTRRIDLLFLDVSMPEKTGIDLLKLIPNITAQVIFITAHSEFAMDAIKLSAVGYVLKPIDDYELSFAINKAIDRIQNRNNITAPINSHANNPSKIGIPNPKGTDYLNIEDILYFESVNKYTKVVTKTFSVVSSYNLAEFKKIVTSNDFLQVHRSFIVSLNHIKRYETSGMLTMDDNMQIPVSKNFKTEFTAAFSKISRTAGLKGKENE